jgi:deazaflavin-dependent oxidoreductase (nitroreductase family)
MRIMPPKLVDFNPSRGPLRGLLRIPLLLYRIRLGRLLGQRFLLLKHIGRKTGLEHRTVLEVLRSEKAHDCYIVCSAWGEHSQWFKNIQQRPEVEIEVGGRLIRATAVRLSELQAEQELRDYARRHPTAYRTIRRLICRKVCAVGENNSGPSLTIEKRRGGSG